MKISSEKNGVFFRKFIVKRVLPLCILELKGRSNVFYNTVYHKYPGIAFEPDEDRAEILWETRPNWWVYERDYKWPLKSYHFLDFPANIIDIHTYSSCWPIFNIFFCRNNISFKYCFRTFSKIGIAVTDYTKRYLHEKNTYLLEYFRQYSLSPDKLLDIYPEICRDLLEKQAASLGFKVEEWCDGGFGSTVTHFAAVLQNKHAMIGYYDA